MRKLCIQKEFKKKFFSFFRFLRFSSLLFSYPLSLLVIEEVGSPPQLASDFHVLFERDGSKASPPVDLFHDGAIGVHSITGYKSQEAQGFPLKRGQITAFFSHLLEAYLPRGHFLKLPESNV